MHYLPSQFNVPSCLLISHSFAHLPRSFSAWDDDDAYYSHKTDTLWLTKHAAFLLSLRLANISCMHDATPTAHNVMPFSLCLSPVAHERALCTNYVNLPLWLCPITSFILQSRPTYTLTHTHMTANCMHSHMHAHDRILYAHTHTHVHALASHALHTWMHITCTQDRISCVLWPIFGTSHNAYFRWCC
jgi:hypothetical protein